MRFILSLAIGLFMAIIIPVIGMCEEEYLSIPFTPEKGDKVRYTIQKTDEKTGSMNPKNTSKAQITYDISFTILDILENGYLVEITYDKIYQANYSFWGNFMVNKTSSLMEGLKIIYIADETGSPSLVQNIADIRKTLTKIMSTLKNELQTGLRNNKEKTTSTEALAKSEKFFSNLTAAQVSELFLKDIAPIFIGTGIQLPINSKHTFELDIPWQLTGTTLVASGFYQLSNITETSANVTFHQGYTRDSVLKGLQVFLNKLVSKNKLKNIREQLEALKKFNLKDDVFVKMNRKDGWAEKITFLREINVGTGKRLINLNITKIE